MKKRLLIIALALIMVLSTACASNPAPATDPTTAPVEATEAPATEPEATAEPAPAEEPFRVAILLPGLISDAGWNAGGYYGAQYLNENVENVEATYIENITTTQAEAAIRDYADQGYDLIVGWSFDMGDYLMKVAPDYPDTKFVWSQDHLRAAAGDRLPLRYDRCRHEQDRCHRLHRRHGHHADDRGPRGL